MKDNKETKFDELLPHGGIPIVDNQLSIEKKTKQVKNRDYKFMSSEAICKAACTDPDLTDKVYGATFPQTSAKNLKKLKNRNQLSRSKSFTIPSENKRIGRTFSMLKSGKNLSTNITANNILEVSVKNHPKSKELTFSVVTRTTTTETQKANNSTTYNSASISHASETKTIVDEQLETSNAKIVTPKRRKSKSREYVDNNTNLAEDFKDEEIRVKCRNPLCTEDVNLIEARTRFKSCHHCFTYYCGKKCRLQHWEKHKEKCIYGKVNSICKRAMRICRDNHNIEQVRVSVSVYTLCGHYIIATQRGSIKTYKL